MKPTLPELLPLVAAYKSRLGNGCGGEGGPVAVLHTWGGLEFTV